MDAWLRREENKDTGVHRWPGEQGAPGTRSEGSQDPGCLRAPGHPTHQGCCAGQRALCPGEPGKEGADGPPFQRPPSAGCRQRTVRV